MSLSNRIAAYDDCIDIFETALASGARVCFETEGAARHFMMRLHQARALQRQESSRIYEPTDLRWGKSSFDKLAVRHPVQDDEGFWWVYIEYANAKIVAVERLDAPPTILQLTGPSDDPPPSPSGSD